MLGRRGRISYMRLLSNSRNSVFFPHTWLCQSLRNISDVSTVLSTDALEGVAGISSITTWVCSLTRAELKKTYFPSNKTLLHLGVSIFSFELVNVGCERRVSLPVAEPVPPRPDARAIVASPQSSVSNSLSKNSRRRNICKP